MQESGYVVSPPRGVLRRAQASVSGAFTHRRVKSPPQLSHCIEHFWMVQWDFPSGSPQVQETLPHPNIHLTFTRSFDERSSSSTVAEVHGVKSAKFSKCLEGQAWVFGVKFRPGGLRCFSEQSTCGLTNHVVPAAQIFGPKVLCIAERLRPSDAIDQMSSFLGQIPTNRNPQAEFAGQLTDLIAEDSTLTKVSALAKKAGTSVRSLERLFDQHVGVSPKWVIRRYRLHEVLERLHSNQTISFSQLAAELAYADQAHLIRDFQQLTGYTPVRYQKSVQMHRVT